MSRRRYVYRKNEQTGEVESFEVGSDWSDAPRSTGDLGKFEYDNLRATDGTPIDSRTKHRRYMREHGVTMASDFREEWSKAAEQRERYYRGEADSTSWRQALERAIHTTKGRKR